LEKRIENRTQKLNENNARLRSIQKISAQIYNEKDKERAVDLILTVMTTFKYYKRGFYFSMEENSIYFELVKFSDNLNLYGPDELEKEAVLFHSELEKNKITITNTELIMDCMKEFEIYNSKEDDIIDIGSKYKISNFMIVPVFYFENYKKNNYGFIILEKQMGDNSEVDDIEKEALKIFAGTLANYFEKIKLEKENIKNEGLKVLFSLSSSIVHELRTPITSIKGFAAMLKSKYTFDDRIIKYSDYIISNSERIDDMAKELIDYVDVNSNENYKFRNINLNGIIDELIFDYENEFKQNNAEIYFEADEVLNLNGDYEKLKKAFWNIIKNSLESFDKDKNILKIYLKKDKRYTSLIFEDNGRGIENEMFSKLFEPLTTTKVQGTGLGLSIIKKIIDLHEAKIQIESQIKIGTKISLFFYYF